MRYSNPKQLCFPPVAGHTLRADFEGGALSSDFGPLLLRGVDRQVGLTERLATAIHDKRHLSYIDHPLRDLLAQRIYQIASGYADGNDANSLRHDPGFKLGVERLPLDATQDLASAPTFSRLEHSVDRKDVYRLTTALVDQFMASYAEPPAAIVLDLDHSDDPTHGQQEFAFYNHHYKSYCYLPLFLYEEFAYAAASWSRPWRGVLKAEVMAAGDNPRFVVTSLAAPPPQMLYEDLYCARGNCENDIKAVKGDLHSDRTSATTFLANSMRLLLACAAYVLHHALRRHTLQHTALAQAQPSTVILTLFKVAIQIKQYKDRILLHLPRSCPVKALLQRVTTLLWAVPDPVCNTS